ncbi:MAG: winged helix-turn-helix domain-containing protein [Acidobacteriota bacterium]
MTKPLDDLPPADVRPDDVNPDRSPLEALRFGDFQIDVGNQLLLRHGEPVSLTPKAFETLYALVQRAGHVLSKEELLERVWPDSFVSEATLSQNIYLLRKVLGQRDGRPWIKTLPRRGYRFEGNVEAMRADPEAKIGAKTEEAAPPRDLAVLPFRRLADDEETFFLGLGMADAIITSLSNVRQLSVRPTSAILRYVDEDNLDAAEVGRELGVDGVLEGSIQRSGKNLRVTVQLIHVGRGVPLWAESLGGAYGDLFAAQDGIARDLVDRLRLRLTRREASGLSRRPAQNLEAHRFYVRGRYTWNRRTAGDLQQAIDLFRRAVALDPTFGRAYSGLADALILLPFYGSARPLDAFRQAREAARRALQLEEGLAEAHTSHAYTDFVYSRDWAAAERGFLRALELDANYATAHHWYAFLLSALGRHDEAIELAVDAQRLDPLSLVISSDLGLIMYFARRFEESREHLRGVLEVAPGFGYAHFGLCMCHSALGDHGDAIAAAREALGLLDSNFARAGLGYCLARAGEHDEARQMLAAMGERPDGGASYRALVLAALGDHGEALEALEVGLEDRSRFGAFIGVWPAFDGLRGDPRFDGLLDRHGLPHPAG